MAIQQVTEHEHSLSELAMCAVRYALGRRTYVVDSVPRAVMQNADFMTDNALRVMHRDVKQWVDGNVNDGIDWPRWSSFLKEIEAVQRQREEIKALMEKVHARESKATKER